MLSCKLEKRLYGTHGVMDFSIQLEVEKGEFLAIMGKSGSGKTTLLRILAGLEEARGEVVVDGVVWQNQFQKSLPPQQREIGFVFQDYALFENMSVEQNLLFVRRDQPLADALLEMTEMTALKDQNVTRLSGGQQQRVSLCRAMMRRPKLLLMDEPLSALDKEMRMKLQSEIKVLHQRFGTTTIMVSHDSEEVIALASRVCLLEEGKIVKDGDVLSLLSQKDQGYLVEVLKITTKMTRRYATISYKGLVLQIEVGSGIEVGDTIEITIEGEIQV